MRVFLIVGVIKLKRNERKSLCLNDLYNDNLEEKIIIEDEMSDDYLYSERDFDNDFWASEYFALENIDLIEIYDTQHQIFKSKNETNIYLLSGQDVYVRVNYNELNSTTNHPVIQSLVKDFDFLQSDDYFTLFFCYTNKWNDRQEPSFEAFLIREINFIQAFNVRIYIDCIFDHDYPDGVQTVYEKVAYQEINNFPYKYEHFGVTEDVLIKDFSTFSSIQAMVEY